MGCETPIPEGWPIGAWATASVEATGDCACAGLAQQWQSWAKLRHSSRTIATTSASAFVIFGPLAQQNHDQEAATFATFATSQQNHHHHQSLSPETTCTS